MAAPDELSMDSIRKFMLSRGGTVTNHELVRHFKYFLTNEETKVHAKMYFKEYVNTLAHISKNEHGEKYLTLKPRYQKSLEPVGFSSPAARHLGSPGSPSPSFSGSLLSVSAVSQENLMDSPGRVPPPYRPPPPPGISPRSSPAGPPPYQGGSAPPPYMGPPPAYRMVEGQEADPGGMPPPPVPPRRRSSDRSFGSKENLLLGAAGEAPMEVVFRPKTEGQETVREQPQKRESASSVEKEPEAKISVKERTQKFNRMASEGDMRHVLQQVNKKKVDKGADDEETRPMDQKDREWLIKASQGDYQALAKLAAEKPKLVHLAEPCVNALHWAAKQGNLDVVKLIAGTYHVNPNLRTRGGLTPLHLAVQFGHDDVRDLLISVYGADVDMRDYSGKKPAQYERPKGNSESTETIHKIKSRKKSSDKDLGFLRIGSLNVRVKRTTEAFSNFFHNQHNNERIHKTWGSADNIQESDQNAMPPPKTLPKSSSKRRRPRRSPSAASIQVVSKPVPVSLPVSAVSLEHINLKSNLPAHHQDSDSDTACGFGDSWK